MSGQNHKILYLTRGGHVYGAQRQLLYLLRGLDRDRFTPVVLCTEEGPFQQELKALHVPHRAWKCAGWRKLKYLFARYRDAADLSRWAAGEGVSLIHGSDFQFSEYLLRSAAKVGVPSILHVRAPIDRQTARKYRCAEATAVVAISRRVELRLAREAGIPANKIVLIHDAVDPNLFRPREPQSGASILRQQYDTGDAVLIGIVGRVERAKEQLAFVRIARQVLEKTTRAAFFLVGEIKDASYHAQIVREIGRDGLAGRVHLTGHREDIAEVLRGLDVLVSLSGGSIRYEAMMCGLPVVCAWSRHPEESVSIRHNETGFLVPERAMEPVSQVLLGVIADRSLRERIGRNAQVWAQAHLTDSALVARTQELYEHLLHRQAPQQT